MENLNYEELFHLQDKTLDIIFEDSTEFYLTGGTCLNRFYYNKRYSDDLDLFTNFSNTFHFTIKNIFSRMKAGNLEYDIQIESKDFVRIIIKKRLQVDFINDRVVRFGKINSKNNYHLDNILNILSNKITAVLSRENAKDIFDIYIISLNKKFSWELILEQAQKKMAFQKEDLVFKLETFPAELLTNIKLIDVGILDNFANNYQIIMDDLLKEKNNSLAGFTSK